MKKSLHFIKARAVINTLAKTFINLCEKKEKKEKEVEQLIVT